MKIVIINGSPRTNGITGQILTKISEILKEMDSGVEINYIDLSKMNLIFCKGCASCYKTGSCFIIEDGLEDVYKKIEECDGVIFGSPTYAVNVSGQFKVFTERGQFPFTQRLRNKACFSVVTYENYGGTQVQKVICEHIRNSGGAVSCKLVYKNKKREKALDSNSAEQIEKLCRKFLNKVKQKNPLALYERLLWTIIFHMGIKPHAFRNKLQFKGVISRWIKLGLIRGRELSQ